MQSLKRVFIHWPFWSSKLGSECWFLTTWVRVSSIEGLSYRQHAAPLKTQSACSWKCPLIVRASKSMQVRLHCVIRFFTGTKRIRVRPYYDANGAKTQNLASQGLALTFQYHNLQLLRLNISFSFRKLVNFCLAKAIDEFSWSGHFFLPSNGLHNGIRGVELPVWNFRDGGVCYLT